MKSPMVPVSWGELVDKITILEIKQVEITNEPAASRIKTELSLLRDVANHVLQDKALAKLKQDLHKINSELWHIEDRIREREADQSFGADFIELARSVYKKNDCRADLKRQINVLLKSELFEEKSYKEYGSANKATSGSKT